MKIIKKTSPKGLRSLIKLDSLSWIISKILIENIGAKSELPDWENQIDVRKLKVREKLNDFKNLEWKNFLSNTEITNVKKKYKSQKK